MSAPPDGYRGRAKRVFQNQVPPDDPRNQLTQGCVGVGVGAPSNRNQRGKFRIAETGEAAGNAGQHEGNQNTGPRELRRSLSGDHEYPGANDGSNAERDQIQRPKGAPQSVSVIVAFG